MKPAAKQKHRATQDPLPFSEFKFFQKLRQESPAMALNFQ